MTCDVFCCNHLDFISFSLVNTLAISLRSGLTFPLSFRNVPLDASIFNLVSSERNCPSLSLRSVSLNSRTVFILIRAITSAPPLLLQMFPQFRLIFLQAQLLHFQYVAWLDQSVFLRQSQFLLELRLFALLLSSLLLIQILV